jgi:hypothetical protein
VGEDSLRDDVRDMVRERVTVQEAARRLGITESAVRKRVQRRLLAHDKEQGGRVFVYLDPAESERDDVRDKVQDRYVRSLEDQIQFLRRELERKDAILLRMAERIPELEAAPEPRESPREATPQPGRVEPQTPLEGAPQPREASHEMHMPEAGGGPLPHDQQTPSERPWWRRMFGGREHRVP